MTRKVLLSLTVLGLMAAALLTAPPPVAGEGDVVRPFNGKNLDGWKTVGPAERSKWKVGKASLNPNDPARLLIAPLTGKNAELINSAHGGVDLYTERKFGDLHLEIEVMVPKGSNSGIYLMGEYEVQVLDSFGKAKVGPGDLGGIYGAAAPLVNASKAPGEWQKFVIDFQAPRFEGDKKVKNAVFLKVTLNGQLIHRNVTMAQQTPGGVTGKEHAEGPLMLQGNHGEVAYRHIRISPLAAG